MTTSSLRSTSVGTSRMGAFGSMASARSLLASDTAETPTMA